MNKARTPFLRGRGLLTGLLVLAALLSLLGVDWSEGILHPGGATSAAAIFRGILTPELSPSFLAQAVEASWRTLAYAVAGLTLAALAAVPAGAVASGVLFRDERARRFGMVSGRFGLGFLRAIHELVWAWLFVVAIGLSPTAAIFALAVPYAGILGRLYADFLVDVPEAPLRALRSAGASEFQVLVYGRLPMALPDMLSYTFYRLECGIRSAAILSFVGIQGLGYRIQLSLDDLLYGQVWTLMFFLIALIVAVDVWSVVVRRSLVR